MPTLDELRRWARGERVDGLPEREPERPPEPGADRRYKISRSGDDALLKFGQHRGRTMKWVVENDRSYAEWITRGNFPADLVDVTRHLLEAIPDAPRKAE